jgi:thiol-disulfide isomerase/thioredoxin
MLRWQHTATHGNFLQIDNGRLPGAGRLPYTVSTDQEGRFQFPHIDFEEIARGRHFPPNRQRIDFVLLFLHDSGFKRLTQQDWEALDAGSNEGKTVTLQLWGRVEGTVRVGTQPGKSLPIWCRTSFNEEWAGYGNEPYVFMDYRTTADESGQFSFDRVPPSFIRASRAITFGDGRTTGSHQTGSIVLNPGETVTVALGGVGRPIIGQLVPSQEFETLPDWTFARIECTPMPERDERPNITELIEKMAPKELVAQFDPVKWAEWLETDDGKKFQAALDELTDAVRTTQERNRTIAAKRRVSAVDEDGTFRLDDIFEGNWTLKVTLTPPLPAEGWARMTAEQIREMNEPIGTLEYEFTVAAVPDGVSDEPLDLGTLEVRRIVPQNPFPRVGEAAPEFEIAKIEPLAADGEYEDTGARLRLSDYRGKYVILDFWATWCGPCLAKLPELKTLYERIKDDDRFVLLGISLDEADSETMLGRFIARREMPWLQGLAGAWQSDTARSYGINAIPALLLIDPDGKVLLSNPSVAELARTIDELRENLPPPR